MVDESQPIPDLLSAGRFLTAGGRQNPYPNLAADKRSSELLTEHEAREDRPVDLGERLA
jgi:hypothetical protein